MASRTHDADDHLTSQDRWLQTLATARDGNRVIDTEHLHDIEQRLPCWGYLSQYPDAERDAAWLHDQLAERDARIAKL